MFTENEVRITGYLGKDPELKYTPGGTAVALLNIATNESYEKDGETVEKTEWHRIVVWRGRAEACGKHLHKGSPVSIKGKLQTRSYEKDGEKRYSTEVVAHFVNFLEKSSSTPAPGDGDAPPERRRPAATDRPADPLDSTQITDEDVPF